MTSVNQSTLDDTAVVQPYVSVIVATYNRADLLPTALDSVLAQTWKDFEVIVVDDGSTDDTVSIVGRYNDPRVRLVQHGDNRGIGAAYNTGMHAARGALLTIFDSDDWAEPTWLERMVQVLRDRPNVGLAWGRCRVHFSSGGRSILIFRNPFGERPDNLLPTMLTWTPGTGALVMRREVFETLGDFETVGKGLLTDLEYAIRFALSGKWGIYADPVVNLHVLSHKGNTSRSKAALHAEAISNILAKHGRAMEQFPCARAHYLYLQGRYMDTLGITGSEPYLSEAAAICPASRKYRLYWLLKRMRLNGVWPLFVGASSVRSRLWIRRRQLTHQGETGPRPPWSIRALEPEARP